MIVDQFYGPGNIAAGAVALHARRRKEHVHRACATRNHVENVPNCSASWRGNNSYSAWENGKRTLKLLSKKSLRLQAIAKLLERYPQCAGANRIESFYN